MKKLLLTILLALFLVVPALADNISVLKVINSQTVSSRTIETNATVCEDDSGDLRIVTTAAHTLSVGDMMQFAAGTGALCAGIAASTDYYVTEVDTTKKVNISTSSGGSNITYTDTGTAFNSYVRGEPYTSTAVDLRGIIPDGSFSLQLEITGSGTAKFEYLLSNNGADYLEPSTASDIVASFTATSGPDSDGKTLLSFRPEPARYIKIRMVETGAANSITGNAWLMIE